MPNDQSLRNLTPWSPGQSGNPKGINQYTYRDEAKRRFAELCKESAEEFLEEVFRLACAGESWAAKLVWEEIMPTVKTVDLNVTEEREPVEVPATEERLKAVAEMLAEIVH